MSRPPPPPLTPPHDRAWVEVRTGALRRNLARINESTGSGVRLIPMVKADGYGLGVERVVAALRPARPFGWGVATVAEGVELQRLGLREPVMVYAPVPPQALSRAVAAGLVPAISDLASLAALEDLVSKRSAPIPFQLEVDTGMGRAGLPLPSPPTPSWWPRIVRATRSGLRLQGIFTHLHSADHPDLASARRQIALFDDFIQAARRAGGLSPDALVHCANSAGALRLVSSAANAVRPGIFLYGGPVGDERATPEAVVSVRARVLLVRDVPPGTTLGYGATHRADGPERWAAVGIGYGDGLPRVLGNRGSAIVRGRRVPIIGRISMDTTVVRTSMDLSPGDIVTFLGRDGSTELPLEEVAELAGTIPYEILTGLSQRLPRVSV